MSQHLFALCGGEDRDRAQVQLVQSLLETVQTLHCGARIQDVHTFAGAQERVYEAVFLPVSVPAQHEDLRV